MSGPLGGIFLTHHTYGDKVRFKRVLNSPLNMTATHRSDYFIGLVILIQYSSMTDRRMDRLF